MKIVGFDAGPKQVQDLKDGVVQALIAQKPATIGADGVQQAYNALYRQAGDQEDRHGFGDAHQGQPELQPGRAVQDDLLSGSQVAPA